MIRMLIAASMLIAMSLSMVGCEKSSDQKSATPQAKSGGDSNAGKTPDAGTSDHGNPIALGTHPIGEYEVRASRDAGAIVPGGDAPIDVWLTGDISKVAAVRFWIGSESGMESIKARADIENKSEPNHWHTHAEVPKPLPEGSRLWVEIETDSGAEAAAFELKA